MKSLNEIRAKFPSVTRSNPNIEHMYGDDDIKAVSKEIKIKLPLDGIYGKRAETRYYKLMDQLKAKGFKEVDSSSETHVANGNVSNGVVYTNGVYTITLSYYIGYELRNNSLNIRITKKLD
jgi:hypothetical protein